MAREDESASWLIYFTAVTPALPLRFGGDCLVALNFGYLPVFAVRRSCPVESPYVEFAEVAEGSGVVWWRGEPLRWRGWSYFLRDT